MQMGETATVVTQAGRGFLHQHRARFGACRRVRRGFAARARLAGSGGSSEQQWDRHDPDQQYADHRQQVAVVEVVVEVDQELRDVQLRHLDLRSALHRASAPEEGVSAAMAATGAGAVAEAPAVVPSPGGTREGGTEKLAPRGESEESGDSVDSGSEEAAGVTKRPTTA